MSEIENGVIHGTRLGIEDHGIFTFNLDLRFAGGGQGYGGVFLDTWNEVTRLREGTAYGCEAIMRVLSTLKVDRWERLPGTHVRIQRDVPAGPITAIGHIIEERWLNLGELFEEFREKAGAR